MEKETSAGQQEAMEQNAMQRDERILAALAHGSILLGIFTNGVGGIAAALVIWLTQKEKSAYVRFQALQALVYQALIFVVTMGLWFCWGMSWLVLLMPPLIANPDAYQNAPPPGLWAGLSLMSVPVCIGLITLLYGLWGAVRCLSGRDFRYLGIGNWVAAQEA